MSTNRGKKRKLCFICGSHDSESSVSHFKFPKNSTRDAWLKFVHLEEEKDDGQLSLCSKHFTEKDLKKERSRYTLHEGAIPTLLPSPTKKPNDAVRRIRCVLCRGNKTDATSHRFPLETEQKKKWANFCAIPVEQVTSHTFLCSRHFHDDDFIVRRWLKEGPRKTLKATAVPSIHLEDEYKFKPTSDQTTKKRIRCYLCGYREKDTSYFKFPKDQEHNRKWRRICKLSDIVSTNKLVLCGRHFRDDEKVVCLKRTTLKPGAIPIPDLEYFPGFPAHSDETISTTQNSTGNCTPDATPEPERSHCELGESDETWKETNRSDCGDPIIEEGSSTLSPSQPVEEEPSSPTRVSPMSPEEMRTPTTQRSSARKQLRYFGDVHTPDLSTPRRAKLCWNLAQRTMKEKNRQLKRKDQNIMRLRKKMDSLSEVIEHLRAERFIPENAAELLTAVIPDIPMFFSELMQRAVQQKRKAYSPAIKKFSLTLQFYSTAAYNYVRKIWPRIFPAPSTLISWYTNAVIGDAGFTQEAFQVIKRKAAMGPLVGTIIMDEMSIKHEVVRAPDKRVYGHVDIGMDTSIECSAEDMPEAKYALVILFVPLFGERWKIPLGYFLIDSFTGKERANLVDISLRLLHNVGAGVKAVTFDGTYTNFTMCKELGAELNYGARVDTNFRKRRQREEGFKPFFKHPCTRENVYIYPDPCHMLKNVRNAFGEVSPLYDRNFGKIHFKYIERVCTLQSALKLRFGNKLTKLHTNYKNKKMKVKLAAQVLSRRVSSALVYLRKEDDNFAGSGPTAQFCLAFNNIFDMLNVKHDATGYHYQQPINPENYAFLKDAAVMYEEYIAGLTRIDGVAAVRSNRKAGFLGFIICLQNVFRIYDDLKDVKGFNGLYSHRLLQDHIETFFGNIRQRGRYNNNPNAYQFKCAYRRLLVQTELDPSKTGNCEVDEDSSRILSVSSRHVRKSNEKTSFREDSPLLLELEESFDPDIDGIPLCRPVKAISTHIAGFIACSLQNRMSCDGCGGELMTTKPDEADDGIYDLIKTKDRGALKYPSEKLAHICFAIEKLFRESEKHIYLNNFRSMLLHVAQKKIRNDESLTIYCSRDPEHNETVLRQIVQKYIDLRIFHYCQVLNENREVGVRSLFSRLVINKHQ